MSKPLDSKFFPRLFDLAHAAGMAAVEKLQVVPMVVTQHANPMDDNSSIQRQWFVPDGCCGFAWVIIRPANCAFAKWMKENKGCRKAYGGGMSYWISAFNQSLQKKEAYAAAFASVVREFGINAYDGSRMD